MAKTKKMMALDASVVLKWFSRKDEELVAESLKIYEMLRLGKINMCAPSFLLVEVMNVLLKKKRLAPTMIEKIWLTLKQLPVYFVPFGSDSGGELVKLAVKYDLSMYDGLYLLLTKQKGLKLISLDKKLLAAKKYTVDLREFVENEESKG